MKIVRINSEVLKDPKSELKHVNAYLASIKDRQDAARLEELWDEADEYWRPLIAKYWQMLTGKNLHVRKIEQGKAEMPESKNLTREIIGDDLPEDDEDSVLVEEREEVDPNELTQTNSPLTSPIKRGRGRPRKNPVPV